MRLARLALQWLYPGGKEPVMALVKQAAAGNRGEALVLAYRLIKVAANPLTSMWVYKAVGAEYTHRSFRLSGR
jgi:hypothetical protein